MRCAVFCVPRVEFSAHLSWVAGEGATKSAAESSGKIAETIRIKEEARKDQWAARRRSQQQRRRP